jgi:hypothetical protein
MEEFELFSMDVLIFETVFHYKSIVTLTMLLLMLSMELMVEE